MATVTITATFRSNDTGALENVTSVVLSDPTGTYGVKRLDNDDVVVDDYSVTGVAMTNSATGVYTQTFTAPAAGLTYGYYLEWVKDGITSRGYSTIAAADATSTGTGTTPANMLANLKITFKAQASGSADRVTLLQDAGEKAAKWVYTYAPWLSRRVVTTIATVDGQAYSSLPATATAAIIAGDYLFEAEDESRPRYIDPTEWDVAKQRYIDLYGDDDDAPRLWTIGYSSSLPIIRWYPLPDAEYTFSLQYLKAWPGITWTSTSAFFDIPELDILWDEACRFFAQRNPLFAPEGQAYPEGIGRLFKMADELACKPGMVVTWVDPSKDVSRIEFAGSTGVGLRSEMADGYEDRPEPGS